MEKNVLELREFILQKKHSIGKHQSQEPREKRKEKRGKERRKTWEKNDPTPLNSSYKLESNVESSLWMKLIHEKSISGRFHDFMS